MKVTWLQNIIRYVRTHPTHAPLLQDGRFMDVSRLVLTLCLGAVLCSIKPEQKKVGQNMCILFLSILIGHPSRTIGAQMVFTVFGIIGTFLSSAYCIIAWEFAAMINRRHNGEANIQAPMLLFCFFIFSQFWMGWIKVYKPMLTHFSLSFQTITVFQLTLEAYQTVAPRYIIFQFAYDFAIGMMLCQLTNIFFFPKFAGKIFRNKLSTNLAFCASLLEKSHNNFFAETMDLDMDFEQKQIVKMRTDINNLHQLRHDLSNEVMLGYFQPSKWKLVISGMNLIQQQLETIHSCLIEKDALYSAHRRLLDILSDEKFMINITSPSNHQQADSLQRMEEWASELFTDPNKKSDSPKSDGSIKDDESGTPKEKSTFGNLKNVDESHPVHIKDLFVETTTQSRDDSPNSILRTSSRYRRERSESKGDDDRISMNEVLEEEPHNSNEDDNDDVDNTVSINDDDTQDMELKKKNVKFLHARKASVEAFSRLRARGRASSRQSSLEEVQDDEDYNNVESEHHTHLGGRIRLQDAHSDDDSDDNLSEMYRNANERTQNSIIEDFDNIPEIELRGDYLKFLEIATIIEKPLSKVTRAIVGALQETSLYVGEKLSTTPVDTLDDYIEQLDSYYRNFDQMIHNVQTKVNFDDEVLNGIKRAAKNGQSPYNGSNKDKSPLDAEQLAMLESRNYGEEIFLIFYCAFAIKTLAYSTKKMVENFKVLAELALKRKRKSLYFPVFRRLLDMANTSDENPIWTYLYKERKRQTEEDYSSTLYPGVHDASLDMYSKHISKERETLLKCETDYKDGNDDRSCNVALYPNDDTIMLQHREQYVNQLLNANTTRSFGQTTNLDHNVAMKAAAMDFRSMCTREAFKLPKEDPETWWRKSARLCFFSLSEFFKTYAAKHGIQMVLCNGSLSLFAYMSTTYSWFNAWKGSWMLVTVTYVLAPTVGDSSLVGIYRSLGTIIGSVWAYVAWLIVPNNPYFSIFMFCVLCYPSGYLLIFGPYNKAGLIACLSYGIVYYNSLNYWHVPITHVALHRCVLTLIGSFWCMFIAMFIFPLKATKSARQTVGKMLSSLSILFSQSIFHMMKPTMLKDNELWESKVAVQHKAFQKMSVGLGTMMNLIDGEIQLEKKFPMKTFRMLVESVNRLVTATVELSMTCSHMGGESYRTIILDPRHVKLRKEYVAVMLLHFHMVTNSVRFKTPMPQKLPSAKAARRRFLTAVYETLAERRETKESIKFLYWNAYMMALEEVIECLYVVVGAARALFGETRHVDLQWDSKLDEIQHDLAQNTVHSTFQ